MQRLIFENYYSINQNVKNYKKVENVTKKREKSTFYRELWAQSEKLQLRKNA